MSLTIRICAIMNLTIKILHRCLSKAHTCCHCMIPKSKLDMLDWSTLGFRVFLKEVPPRSPSILLIFVPHLSPLFMYFDKPIVIKFCHLCSWCLKGELLWTTTKKTYSSFPNSLNFLILNPCKLLRNKNLIKFYSWMSIIIEHWSIVHLASGNNILRLVALILMAIWPSTNRNLIKRIKILFWRTKDCLWHFKLKSWFDIWFRPSYLGTSLDPQFVIYENLQCFWILESCHSTAHFEEHILESRTWNWDLISCFVALWNQ
jgi:hypothetical protein